VVEKEEVPIRDDDEQPDASVIELSGEGASLQPADSLQPDDLADSPLVIDSGSEDGVELNDHEETSTSTAIIKPAIDKG
jgi:hypothetical protein